YTVRFGQRDGADGPLPNAASPLQTLDGASFRSPVAPGSIATVFQPNLASSLNVASTVPLPNSLNGLSMRVNDSISVPLFATSPTQANIQIPWELDGESSATLRSVRPDGTSETFSVPLARFAPAIFSVNERGSGQGTITLANSRTLAAAAGSVE